MGQPNLTKKKYLGQYFTGTPLAKFLAHLSGGFEATSVIDPMCGIGDMFTTLLENHESSVVFAGIELDPYIYNQLTTRFSRNQLCGAKFLQGNAFDLDVLEKLPEKQFDLVITNPPYVRYQTLSKTNDLGFPTLNALEIRNNLLKAVSLFPALNEEDKKLFIQIISSYSGLSDLAVPSWILCAMLTRIGGKIAMVVPDTWLNREYAQIIQYMLLRWFRIEYVIEDANSGWFADAQVKTTLLVAKRIERLDSAFSWNNENYLHLLLFSNAGNKKSIVGRLFPNEGKPEKRFALELKKGDLMLNNFGEIRSVLLSDKAKNLKFKSAGEEWLNKLEGHVFSKFKTSKQIGAIIPYELSEWIGSNDNKITTLENYGIKIGQGLRTGANDFFYVDIKEKVEGGWIVKPNKIFGIAELFVPFECLLPVVRKQTELNKKLIVNQSDLKGGVLVLKEYVLPEDFVDFETNPMLKNIYKPMPDGLCWLIRKANSINLGTINAPKYIPELSAVKPNIRRWHAKKSENLPRFWYMLPVFTKRHCPEIFIPRINNSHPIARMNSKETVLIDANFSTIWSPNNFSKMSMHSLFALLNSSWCQAGMELVATVMGGGALKLEAVHLRKLPIPILSFAELSNLDRLGKELVNNPNFSKILEEIDFVVTKSLVGESIAKEKMSQLQQIKFSKLSSRIKFK